MFLFCFSIKRVCLHILIMLNDIPVMSQSCYEPNLFQVKSGRDAVSGLGGQVNNNHFYDMSNHTISEKVMKCYNLLLRAPRQPVRISTEDRTA